MSMYDKNHCNIVISLQLIKINEKKKILSPDKHIHSEQQVPGPLMGLGKKCNTLRSYAACVRKNKKKP